MSGRALNSRRNASKIRQSSASNQSYSIGTGKRSVSLYPHPPLSFPSLTAEALENALELSPMSELTLFQNRHIFEYVVIYDQNSTTQSSTMRPLIDAIFVNSIHGKGLKHPPMFLIGGLDGWKQKYGDGAVVKGHGGESSRSFNISSASTSYSASRPLPMEPVRSSDTYGQTNGNGPMSPTNYSFASPPMEPTQLWSPPRSRPDTASAPQAQAFRPSPDYSHRPAFSLDQSSNHTRFVSRECHNYLN